MRVPAHHTLCYSYGRMGGKDFVVIMFLSAWISADSCAASPLLAFLFEEITFGVCGTSHFVIEVLETLTVTRDFSALSSLTTE